MSAAATTMTGGAPAGSKQPLDAVMLAMDVVDTLRRRQRLLDKELAGEESAADLKERLRKIYAAQGIEVPDSVLEEGVRALREDRFVYQPPADSLGTRLARLYVSRGKWWKWLLGGFAGLLLAIGGYWQSVVEPRVALPQQLVAMHQQVSELARGEAGRKRADALLAAGQAALLTPDQQAATTALDSLRQLGTELGRSYTLRIVARPGEKSGVWRIPNTNEGARNYYLIVEAVDADGKRVPVTVTSEESGNSEQVERWGLRVDKPQFDAVAADKQDDGIIQNRQVGSKRAGYLRPEYTISTSGAVITKW